MRRLLNANRAGGFPLTGESIDILAGEFEKWIKAMFQSCDIPNRFTRNQILFFRNFMNSSLSNTLKDGELVYNTKYGFCELAGVTALNINYNDLRAGIVRVEATINEVNYSDFNIQGTFADTRQVTQMTLRVQNSTTWDCYDFKDFVKWQANGVPNMLDLSQIKFWKMNTITFVSQDLSGATQISGSLTGGSEIVRQGEYLSLYFGFSAQNMQYKAIELPASFAFFNRQTLIRCLCGNSVATSLAQFRNAIAIYNYIIFSDIGTTEFVSDYVRIN